MFFVAIPSYARWTRIVHSSLRTCITWGIPQHDIYVFVIEEQRQEYQNSLHMHGFADVHLICGPLGLHHMRNFITRFFDEDTPILHMDDDIDELLVMHEDPSFDVKSAKRYPLRPACPSDMYSWIERAFMFTKKQGASLFGIYPVRNGYFMKDLPEITTNLRFCVGAFWGMWNRKDIVITVEEKEDFDRTLQAYALNGCVVRYNRYCPKTQYYKTAGGMQSRDIDRKKESEKSCAYLCERWPMWCRIYRSKKNGMCEVRLSHT